jgi:hypothetical protein
MAKVLVTGGCSFSELQGADYGTWPNHLSATLSEYQHIATGLGSQGNGLISRRVIYEVSELLKATPAEDILVGIMWSGPERHDFFNEDVTIDHSERKINSWVENPTGFVKDINKNWIIISPSWQNYWAKQYYANFHSYIGGIIYTYEHILRVQWFLKLHGIKYFMTTYTSEVLHNWHIDQVNVTHLYEQIDFNDFLPVVGEWDWCNTKSEIPFTTPNDGHPNKAQHQAFTEQIIIPFLKDKNYI